MKNLIETTDQISKQLESSDLKNKDKIKQIISDIIINYEDLYENLEKDLKE